jgi:Flp pilus assembly pilin Flp
MLKVFKLLDDVLRDEDGADMVEYALLVTLIALVAGVTIYAVGNSVSTAYGNVNACLTSVNATGC